ncbi:LLM class flavin-dependent oxidoreductase (plasmid) [Pedobacter sp. BS3]|uniref:LLM class flavin-dependent oxidoreductase n=1 Tax=Pedobacter sp. BS3 TaxID=2567937 RepID=UPI0011F02754|nr:LLM class flavin-dependent oxidoreductase [Pedobacter sp. BS3]TZF86116.1 LLM class flavin-dependent oxidoreductase [Pedobacter sp. BS3]
MADLHLSILDQSPVRKGVTAQQAVQETIELVKLADKLGYTRFWVSEHHNTTTLAGSTPEVLIAHLAGETKRIRLGSGGIMLPNHSALKVAENFRMLEVLFPGRIDLGIGRAPGTDRITASVLNPSNRWNEQDFIEQIIDLQNYLHDTADTNSAQPRIIAIPQAETVPPLWLLTSSGQSGLFAAHFGLAVAFAHFINPIGGPEAIKLYRNRFQPSLELKQPEANVAIFVFCSEDEEKVKQHQAVMDYRFLQLEKGGGLVPITYQDIKDVLYTSFEQERIAHNRKRTITGNPGEVKSKLLQLAKDYQTTEIMTVTITEHFEDRLRSYELLADMFGLY